MKKFGLSLFASGVLFAGVIEVERVVVEERESLEISQEVGKDEIRFTRQQDLAKILFETFTEINIVRSSAIGNDLIIRGFKKDDINVLIDGAKVYGGCPNRMDPPSMHISASQIEKVLIKEGPFDVEYFSSLGALIDVKTKDPKKGESADISYIYGSFDYNKLILSLNSGDDRVKVLFGYSYETSNQYKDGDGKSLVEQQLDKLPSDDPNRYQALYKDIRAYRRDSLWTKLLINLSKNQELRINGYKDKAVDVLYPAFVMDADLDDTIMLNSEYSIKNLLDFSKKLTFKLYYSDVKHDMSTKFREAGLPATNSNRKYRTHRTRSIIKGAKIENIIDFLDLDLKLGLDGSIRNWKGVCLNDPSKTPIQIRIPDVATKNRALFVKGIKDLDNLSIKVGLRFDKTDIDANNLKDPTIANIAAIQNYYANKTSKSYNNFSANLILKYKLNSNSSFFIGFGQGIRVPDAQELYFIGYSLGNWTRRGNPDLKETKNRELDIGYEIFFSDISLKLSAFYSDLKDYIYAYKTNDNNADPNVYYLTWTNIDAHIYGGDISLFYMINDQFSLEAGAAYQRGKKDTFVSANQTDKDLAQIPPLKGRIAINYDNDDYFAKIEVLGSAKYKDFDMDNAEQEIDSWVVINIKASKELTKNITLNAGVDNIFDKKYAVNNTYGGRSLIGGANPVLINEPGRYLFANLSFRF